VCYKKKTILQRVLPEFVKAFFTFLPNVVWFRGTATNVMKTVVYRASILKKTRRYWTSLCEDLSPNLIKIWHCVWKYGYKFDYILITNLMHWLLFIHKIIFSSTCFEPHVLIFRRIQLCTCSIWYCHSVNGWVVECY